MQLVPVQANSDQHLIALWLRSQNSPNTRRSYQLDAVLFTTHVAKPLSAVTLGDLQAFADSQSHLSPSSLARRISTIKSLLSFGHRLGYLPVNIGSVVRLPAVKDSLAERIMTEADVHSLLQASQSVRDSLLLRLVYAIGLRVSEACSLKSRDLRATSATTGTVCVFGKGGKTRTIAVGGSVWAGLLTLRSADPEAPVFVSRKTGCRAKREALGRGGPVTENALCSPSHGHLDVSAVHRIVKGCVERAGLSASISCHWLRHAHVSHALDHGAPVHLVQQTVGHASLETTSRYAHARPSTSSQSYLSA